MPLVKLYTPIVCDGHDKHCFRVNGSTNQDKDESIRLARQHVAFRHKDTKIIRIEECEEWDYNLNKTY